MYSLGKRKKLCIKYKGIILILNIIYTGIFFKYKFNLYSYTILM